MLIKIGNPNIIYLDVEHMPFKIYSFTSATSKSLARTWAISILQVLPSDSNALVKACFCCYLCCLLQVQGCSTFANLTAHTFVEAEQPSHLVQFDHTFPFAHLNRFILYNSFQLFLYTCQPTTSMGTDTIK